MSEDTDFCIRCGVARKGGEDGIAALCWAATRPYCRRHRWASTAANAEQKRRERGLAKLEAWKGE